MQNYFFHCHKTLMLLTSHFLFYFLLDFSNYFYFYCMQICWYLHCLKRLLQIEGGSFWNIKQWLYRHWAKGVCQWGAKEQCSSRHWAIWRELKALSNSIKVFPAAKTKTTMIHAAILFSIHHDSELPSGKFRLQCRQTPLNLMKGKSSFELVSKSI